ncbi:MAG: hypothetical protein NTV49_16300 [Kiritimatiellaeota bacterium]|nr:hypothetical protein [Kiritimatiellota bacterium]
MKVCPYNAISFLPDKKVSLVNDILVAVEIVEDRVFGESFTPPVLARYEEIFRAVRDRLQDS